MLTAMKKILLPAIAILTLSACEDPFNREGIGFTGIDGEPKSISDAQGAASELPPATNIPEELAAIPTVQVVSDKSEISKVAEVAIENGGRTDTSAVVLTGKSANLLLSTVSVNGTLFGVLRTVEGEPKVDNSVGAAFGRRTEQFTGCLPAGDVYRKGSSKKSSGFAVPLNCS